MKEKINMLKFESTSILNGNFKIDSIKELLATIRNRPDEKLMILISNTDDNIKALEKVLDAYTSESEEVFKCFESAKANYIKILEELFPKNHEIYASINDALIEIEWIIEESPEDDYNYLYDQMVSVGEIVSSKIVAAYLNAEGLETYWLDARDVIQTDNDYRKANIDWETTMDRVKDVLLPVLEKTTIILSPNIIGSSSENFTTRIGEGEYWKKILKD